MIMLKYDYTIDLFGRGLGRDYYGYHNINHELEVTYFTVSIKTRKNKIYT